MPRGALPAVRLPDAGAAATARPAGQSEIQDPPETMTHLHLTPNSENHLKHLYIRTVEGERSPLPKADDATVGELLRRHLVQSQDGKLALTKEGQTEAARVVRRHRLAERLLHDVLNVHDDRMNETACQFEHSLHHGVEESICALLGHPKTCPHGRPIPPGKCCSHRRMELRAAVVPLVDMKPKESGVVAYLSSRKTDVVQKLMALGVLPGIAVRVIQTFPSIVAQFGQTQVALDQSLAGDIYIRRNSER
jgi:DtxR family Mn-dependent transcriptional regulator